MSESPRTRRRATTAMFVAGSTLAATALALLPGTATASSHREAPADRGRPGRRQHRPVRVRQPRTSRTTSRSSPTGSRSQEPNGGPNFYPFATDAALQHQRRQRRRRQGRTPTFRWTFKNDRQARQQHVPLQQRPGHLARRREPAVPADLHAASRRSTARRSRPGSATRRSRRRGIGAASMPDYADAARPGHRPAATGGWKVFAGQADDPFFLDLRVFDLLYGGDLSEVGPGHPRRLQRQHHRAAGAVQATWRSRATPSATRSSASGHHRAAARCGSTGTASPRGDWVQVSRLGNPLVNEVVVPAGLKDAFNSLTPGQGRQHPGRRRPGHRPRGAEADRGDLRRAGARRPRATTWSRSS